MTNAAQTALDKINPDDADAGFRTYLAYQRAQARATEAKDIIARFGGSAELKAHAVELQQTARELYAAYKAVA